MSTVGMGEQESYELYYVPWWHDYGVVESVHSII